MSKEPTKEIITKWLDFASVKNISIEDEWSIKQAICRLIKSQPEVDEKFIERWLEQNWNENWCNPAHFNAILGWLIKLTKEAGVRIKGKEKA